MTLSYNPCLLVIIAYAFGLVGMQIDDTLILKDNKFKALKYKELVKANITTKLIKQLLLNMLLIFNRCVLRQKGDSILLV
jgi:hypothetical protein